MRQSRVITALTAASCLLLTGYLLLLHASHGRRALSGAQNPAQVDSGGYFGGKVVRKTGAEQESYSARKAVGRKHTFDNWPDWPKYPYKGPIPDSPFYPNYSLQWDFDTSSFLQRPDVVGQPPKLMTWMVKPRYIPELPDPVRLRMCPEMPCRMSTNSSYQKESAALMWNGELMRDKKPPVRSNPDQVFLFHNHEPQKPQWIYKPSFRKPAWKSAFNWTMTYRFDSDIVDLYGYMAMRETVPVKNYTNILAKKTKFAAWLVSNCWTPGKRMDYIKRLQKLVPVDIYGGCGPHKCPRSHDNACFEKFSTQYKFYLSFESGICQDYVSEKFFRYMETDAVVVARGDGHKYLAPRGTFVNTADFAGIRELADHLKYLDANTEEYINILKAKDEYVPLYEDYPIRDPQGNVKYMAYHYEAVSFCETCRRLWDLDNHRKTIADLPAWFDKGNCYPPEDITDV